MLDATLILMLHLTDAIVALVNVQAGIAEGANPLAQAAFAGGAAAFLIVKLALVGVAVMLLVRLIRSRPAAVALPAGAIGYVLLG